ncbi:Morphogenesis-related protein MSB1 [Cytospora mali]|uniref:Morphogenesis-related protein MSB1 n=1 Tax=Cytospora mali TaxID=578113 RepID=A0A194W2R6_CYTMA|nr:Morphogenesis-related protein MSB1 [Valsa mali]
MPGLFSRLKKDGKSKKNTNADLLDQQPAEPRWTDAWARTTVEPEEIHELVRRCTEEIKSRALDHPFILLPFRPTSDPSGVRTFIRHFFDNHALRGEALVQELRMAEPMVIAGAIKWCWSRLAGGVVGWDAYELFRVGEQDSNMARDSFKTFIPLSVDNGARCSIIFNYFDLMSAIAAHGKMNGFGGRKLSRMAAWWAFEQKDTGSGFDSGYKEWLKSADATSHLFFAYLRTLAPEQQTPGAISMLPMSLQKLLQETEYPPMRPVLMQTSTYKVVMIVESVSPTPFALLRRANHFQYRESSLQHFSEYEDPVAALTEECRRVLRAVAAANQTQAVSSAKHSTSLRDASWSRFEDIGFTSALDDEEDDESSSSVKPQQRPGLRTTPASGANSGGRPTTPSWADFLSSGFVDDGTNSPNLLPPDKQLPPIDTAVRQRSAQSHRPRLETALEVEAGELASINTIELDDAFWWVWMNSLAPEETAERKAAFGRCAVIETIIRDGRWLVFEEVLKGAAAEPQEGAYVAEKKSLFSWTRRNKDKSGVSRSKSAVGKNVLERPGQLKPSATTGAISKSSLGPDQQARIQAAAQQLQAKQEREKRQAAQGLGIRRGRTDEELMAEKTKSVMTLQPMIVKEASSAMKWANNYDKGTIRDTYLSHTQAGRGNGQQTPTQTNGHPASNGFGAIAESPSKPSSLIPPPSPSVHSQDKREGALTSAPLVSESGRDSPLPPLPKEEPTSMDSARVNMTSPEPAEGLSPKAHRKLQKGEKKGGFRKLFGRNKRGSKLPENAAGDLNHMLASDEGRQTPESSVRENPETPRQETPRQQPAGTPATRSGQATPAAQATEEPAERVSKEPTNEDSVHEDVSRVDTADAEEAQDAFSRFDQGPLQDQPAFVPDDDVEEEEDDSTPPPIQRHRSPAPAETAPEEPKARSTFVSQEQQQAPAIERWAQIRENAAKRAAAAQQRESQEQSRPSIGRTESDRSAEETIESRVARIKARVAEITNNMEGAQGPGVVRPTVPR